MPAAIHGVKTAAISSPGWVRLIAGRGFIPRDRQVSPRGAQIATRASTPYWLSLSLGWEEIATCSWLSAYNKAAMYGLEVAPNASPAPSNMQPPGCMLENLECDMQPFGCMSRGLATRQRSPGPASCPAASWHP